MDSLITSGPKEDPYFEPIPEEELHFYQRKGAKRKRKLPGFIPEDDLRILNSVKRKAYRLDLQLSICGFRLGWAGVIGLIPWLGDIIAAFFALQLVHKAETITGGLPAGIRLKMMANIIWDFAMGLIPLVGDFMNILYKCNSRNFILLEKHLVEKYSALQTTKPVETNTVPETKPRAMPTDEPVQETGIINSKSDYV